jgi:hypothetical protein
MFTHRTLFLLSCTLRFLLLEIGLLSRSIAPVVAVVKSVHAFALFSGIQRHAAAAAATTIYYYE